MTTKIDKTLTEIKKQRVLFYLETINDVIDHYNKVNNDNKTCSLPDDLIISKNNNNNTDFFVNKSKPLPSNNKMKVCVYVLSFPNRKIFVGVSTNLNQAIKDIHTDCFPNLDIFCIKLLESRNIEIDDFVNRYSKHTNKQNSLNIPTFKYIRDYMDSHGTKNVWYDEDFLTNDHIKQIKERKKSECKQEKIVKNYIQQKDIQQKDIPQKDISQKNTPKKDDKNYPINHGKRWTHKERHEIDEDFKNKMTQEEIAAKHGRSLLSIQFILSEFGHISKPDPPAAWIK